MDRLWARLLVVLLLLLCCGSGWGAEWPFVVTHQLTSYEKESGSVTIGYALQVVNGGDKGVSDLKLTVYPPLRMSGVITVLDVGALEPGQMRELSFLLRSPVAPPREIFAGRPLSLGGECRDADGNFYDFPVTSYPGGVR